MTDLNSKGFTVIETLLIIAIVAIVGAVGWYVYDQRKDESAQSAITNFDECVAAGNPVMESYPEQCAADGRTFTNPNQKVTEAKEEDSWFLFEPTNKKYTLRIPDGWKATELSSNLYVRDASSLEYIKGTKATVEVLSEGGWDGASPFALYYPEQNSDEIVKEGTKVGEILTDEGLKVEKYRFVQTTNPDGIGYQKGDTAYSYYFEADGRYIVVSHVFSEEAKDHSETVERLIKTIKVN